MYVQISLSDSQAIMDQIKREIEEFWAEAWDKSVVSPSDIRAEITKAFLEISNINKVVEEYQCNTLVTEGTTFNEAIKVFPFFEKYGTEFCRLMISMSNSEKVDPIECGRIGRSMQDVGLHFRTASTYYFEKRCIPIEVKSTLAKRAVKKYFEEQGIELDDVLLRSTSGKSTSVKRAVEERFEGREIELDDTSSKTALFDEDK